MNNTSKYYQKLIEIQSQTPKISTSSMFMVMRDLVDKAEQDGIAAIEAKDKETAELRKALSDAATSLKTISKANYVDSNLEPCDIKAYANSRSMVAFKELKKNER